MTIEFHCEHCGEAVTAPKDKAGRRGKCPHCGQKVYIPVSAEEDSGELPLAPLDPEEERRRLRGIQEAADLQYRLLHEQALPGEMGPRRGGPRRDSGPGIPGKPAQAKGLPRIPPKEGPPRISPREVNRMVVQYVEAMAGGRLDEARKLTTGLGRQQSDVLAVLDDMVTKDLSGYGLPVLPRPVLLGFLKQLRTEVQRGAV
ncbi:MAG: hypothetical protein JXQ75_11080 [Phycisphaerae bacterium]|nr:hypothetical protein [Phycisphaerae bacterium]